MRFYFPLLLLLLTVVLEAQPTGISKCSPALVLKAQQRAEQGSEPFPVTLVVQDEPAFRLWAAQEGLPVWAAYPAGGVLVLEDRVAHFWDTTLLHPAVLFADLGYREGFSELLVPGHNLFVNNITAARKRFPATDGSGVTVSVKEFRFDSSDVDFLGRHVPNPASALTIDPHATIMTTLIGGAGNSAPSGAGAAPGCRLLSSSYIGLLPDADTDYENYDIGVQNHSYGIAIENYYGAAALAYDVTTQQHPELLHVFSAGNQGVEAAPSGVYAGLSGWANLSGNFKMAKNVLTVGAVDSFYRILPFSSRGPAYDGRLKPELVAFGQDGSSGAAALVSGAAAVVRQAFWEEYGYLPSSALLRAVLIGAADDLGESGPDFIYGYGNLDLKNALELVQNRFMAVATVSQGDSAVFTFQAPANARDVRVTLCWNDIPAAPNAPQALVNDLNLRVLAPDGNVHLPWILNAGPSPDSLIQAAQRGVDTLNTVEQVFIGGALGGIYQVAVRGTRVSNNLQQFALVFNWDTLQGFEWTYPLTGNPATAGKEAVLRWETGITNPSGRLDWKPVGALDWRLLADSMNLAAGWHKWLLPDTFTEAQMRMRIGGIDFVSDTFLIAPELRLRVGYNCPDSILLYWSPAGNQATYRLWGLGTRYLEPLLVTTDTFFVLGKQIYTQTRYAVSAIGAGGVEGPRSPAPDINFQATGCFINQLLAFLNDLDQAELRLDLSTLYQVERIRLEKRTKEGIWIVLTEQSPTGLQIDHIDPSPHPGVNSYRAQVQLDNGVIVVGEEVVVYYAGPAGVLLFASPVPAGEQVTVLSRFVVGTPRFLLYDAMGRQVLEQELVSSPMEISLAGLPPGGYFWAVVVDGTERLAAGVLMIEP